MCGWKIPTAATEAVFRADRGGSGNGPALFHARTPAGRASKKNGGSPKAPPSLGRKRPRKQKSDRAALAANPYLAMRPGRCKNCRNRYSVKNNLSAEISQSQASAPLRYMKILSCADAVQPVRWAGWAGTYWPPQAASGGPRAPICRHASRRRQKKWRQPEGAAKFREETSKKAGRATMPPLLREELYARRKSDARIFITILQLKICFPQFSADFCRAHAFCAADRSGGTTAWAATRIDAMPRLPGTRRMRQSEWPPR